MNDFEGFQTELEIVAVINGIKKKCRVNCLPYPVFNKLHDGHLIVFTELGIFEIQTNLFKIELSFIANGQTSLPTNELQQVSRNF